MKVSLGQGENVKERDILFGYDFKNEARVRKF
jgi:hypothetical protein